MSVGLLEHSNPLVSSVAGRQRWPPGSAVDAGQLDITANKTFSRRYNTPALPPDTEIQ